MTFMGPTADRQVLNCDANKLPLHGISQAANIAYWRAAKAYFHVAVFDYADV